MTTITNADGTALWYKDWGAGQPVLFSHGWPLSADAWDDQMLFLSARGYRTIAHDRRGHGRSDQPSGGNDLDTYAEDLATLIDKLDLDDIILVGHSTGGGEVVRFITRLGSARVAKLVLVSAIPPLMLRTEANPDGVPIEEFDRIRQGLLTDRAQFYRDLAEPFFGANRPGATVSQGIKDDFWAQSMKCGLKNAHECVAAFSETDLTADLQKIDVPTLIVHGDDDQIVPIANSALKTARIVRDATLKVYAGASHGIPQTRKAELNADLLAFITGRREAAPGADEAKIEVTLTPALLDRV